jgi:hypothetical protein
MAASLREAGVRAELAPGLDERELRAMALARGAVRAVLCDAAGGRELLP